MMTRTFHTSLKTAALAAAIFAGGMTAAPAVAGHHDHDKKSYNKSGNDIVATAKAAGQFSTLLTAAKQAGLVDALKAEGPLTVFAPTDAAFAKLPEGAVANLLKPENRGQLQAILTYHVVPGKVKASDVVKLDAAKTLQGQSVSIETSGGNVMIDGATVTSADIMASNGVIHVIDEVILPKNIVQLAQSAGQFNTLVAALEAAELKQTVAEANGITVFAPTDAAFAALPEGTVETLLKPENRGQLQAILKYHVAAGSMPAAKVVEKKQIATLQGQPLPVEVTTSNDQTIVRVGGAQVVVTDLPALNGVVHVIDAVVLPPAESAAADAQADQS